MPRPSGLLSRTFASDSEYDLTPGKPWSEQPNKVQPPDLGQGFTPGERPAAPFVNHQLHAASKMRFLDDIAERNWGIMYFKGTFKPAAIDFIQHQHLYIAALAEAPDSVWTSHNGTHWDNETTVDTDNTMCNVVAVGARAVLFQGTNSSWHVRQPSAYGAGGYDDVAQANVTLWNRVLSSSGTLTGVPYLVDPITTNRLWHLYSQTVSGTKRIGIARITVGDPSSIQLITGEIASRTSYVWSEIQPACFGWLNDRRVVFGHEAGGSNQIWHSGDSPGYLTDWSRVSGHDLVAGTVGTVVGSFTSEDGEAISVVTSTGRVYRATDDGLVNWSRIDAALLPDFGRTFMNVYRSGATLLAQGRALYTEDSFFTEGHHISRDEGVTWDFVPSPIDYRQSDGHPDGNMFRVMQNGQMVFMGSRISDDGGAWAFALKTRDVK